jgi:Clostripain family
VADKRRTTTQAETWTIMLYLSGDNNLSEEMVRALADIKIQGVPTGITFTIQYDPQAPGFPTYRYAITSAKFPKTLALAKALHNEARGPLPIPEYLARRLKNEDSADPGVLARFINWSARKHPSTYRMLILSGHGSGAVGDFLSDNNARQGQPGSFTIPVLAKALKRAKTRVHVLGMDSCLMGMAEVAYQVRHRVDHLVGSEGFVPNTGWPYAHLLKQLKLRKGMGMAPPEVAARLVEDVITYYKQYIPAGTSIDMVSCDIKQLGGVVNAVKDLTQVLRLLREPEEEIRELAKTVRDLVITAHWQAQSYKFEQYTDLWDFCDRLQDLTGRLRILLRDATAPRAKPRATDHQREPAGQRHLRHIAEACALVKDTIDGMAKPADHSGPDFQHSHGLAVFFPWCSSTLGGVTALKNYGRLDFAKDSRWATFLDAYLMWSEREPRKEDGELLPGTQRPALSPVPPSGKHAEGVNKHAEGVNKFADLIQRLALGGTALPWSMKNPPQGVRWRTY